MGHKNFDRWPTEAWRGMAGTVGRMRALKWTVFSHCATCNLTMIADLDLIIRIKGPDYSLWNRRAQCRRVGCRGRVEFQARPPELYTPIVLRAEWPAAAGGGRNRDG